LEARKSGGEIEGTRNEFFTDYFISRALIVLTSARKSEGRRGIDRSL